MNLSEEGVIILYTPSGDGIQAELKREVTKEVAELEARIRELEVKLKSAAEMAFYSEVVETEMLELETPSGVSIEEFKSDWINEWIDELPWGDVADKGE